MRAPPTGDRPSTLVRTSRGSNAAGSAAGDHADRPAAVVDDRDARTTRSRPRARRRSCRASLAGAHRSSSSRNATHSVATRSRPRLRAADTPARPALDDLDRAAGRHRRARRSRRRRRACASPGGPGAAMLATARPQRGRSRVGTMTVTSLLTWHDPVQRGWTMPCLRRGRSRATDRPASGSRARRTSRRGRRRDRSRTRRHQVDAGDLDLDRGRSDATEPHAVGPALTSQQTTPSSTRCTAMPTIGSLTGASPRSSSTIRSGSPVATSRVGAPLPSSTSTRTIWSSWLPNRLRRSSSAPPRAPAAPACGRRCPSASPRGTPRRRSRRRPTVRTPPACSQTARLTPRRPCRGRATRRAPPCRARAGRATWSMHLAWSAVRRRRSPRRAAGRRARAGR